MKNKEPAYLTVYHNVFNDVTFGQTAMTLIVQAAAAAIKQMEITTSLENYI